MEGLKSIYNIVNILCDEQQKRGCEICPAHDLCDKKIFDKAKQELSQSGHCA